MLITIGYKITKFEPIIGYDLYIPDNGNPDKYNVKEYNNISLGVNYYHSKKIKIQANYILRK